MKKFMREFKEFITKGNVMDLAVGVIIGAAFKDIVTSLTDNIISPILGLFGGMNFSNWKWEVTDSVVITYGAFLTAVINFIIMAFIIFLMVKFVRNLENVGELLKKKKEEEVKEAPTTKICPFCKSEISIDATRCPHCTSVIEE